MVVVCLRLGYGRSGGLIVVMVWVIGDYCLFWLLCVLHVVCVDLVDLVVCYGLDGVVYYCVFVTLGVGVLGFAGLIVWLLWL